jgi:hypothetical protein
MLSQEGWKGPGIMGMSSCTSGKSAEEPRGTLPLGNGWGISGMGGSSGRVLTLFCSEQASSRNRDDTRKGDVFFIMVQSLKFKVQKFKV